MKRQAPGLAEMIVAAVPKLTSATATKQRRPYVRAGGGRLTFRVIAAG